VQQMVVDPEGVTDWVLEFKVDVIKSRDSGEPVLGLRTFDRLGSII
jgi:hypothetical protein